MKYIVLANGTATKVDDEDCELFCTHKWHNSNGYVSRHKNDGSGSKLYLHRLIMQTPPDMQTDHINGDKLDNRRSNLRIVTARQNRYNMKPKKTNRSGFKGVSYHKLSSLWRARIGTKTIGYFKTAELAHEAYCREARLLYGEYARFIG